MSCNACEWPIAVTRPRRSLMHSIQFISNVTSPCSSNACPSTSYNPSTSMPCAIYFTTGSEKPVALLSLMSSCLTPHWHLSPLNSQQEAASQPNLGAIRPPGAVALQPMEFSGATVTDDDPIVMDALPQSLGCSEFIHSSML